ncbi:hemolysin family protein [Allofustis seminis]|uniref:hemolysin family protein n=1 Tax=Allofustis seminis TaxID=166939 RepID=UPI00036D4BDE|nr:hemolysin family protein [Allofustis seminis]
MKDNIALNAFLILIFILMSAFFSASESAFTSINLIRLKSQADKGDQKAVLILKLREQFDWLLSGILIGNNIVNIGASAVATTLFLQLSPEYGGVISTIAMTILILIFSEITPKTIATEHSEGVARTFAPFLRLILLILSPFIWVLSKLTNLIVSLFKKEQEDIVSDEELFSLVDRAEQTGNLSDYERRLIRSAIAFDDMEVSGVLTPRMDIEGFSIHDDLEKIKEVVYSNNHSRLIVYDETIDDVLGFIHEKTFSRYMLNLLEEKVSLQDLIMEVIYAPPTTRISKLLTLMQGTHLHMAVIKDEYGGTVGIVTMEDVLEALVGEIWDEGDVRHDDVVQIKENIYEVVADMNLKKFMKQFGIVPDRTFESTRVSGFFIELLDRIPEKGDQITYGPVSLTVNKMVEDRVLSFLVSPINKHKKRED